MQSIEEWAVEVFKNVGKYLNSREYYKLMACSKRFTKKLKGETWRILVDFQQFVDKTKLWIGKVDFDVQNFTSQLMRLVNNPEKQVSFRISAMLTQAIIDHLLQIKCHKINIENADRIHHFPKWTEMFTGMESVSLNWNAQVTAIDPLPASVTHVQLNNFKALTDIKYCQSLKELKLINCAEISDVSPLKDLHKLILKQCPNVKNVHGLGRIHDLTIIHCLGVENINPLTHNHRLTIYQCQNIRKHSMAFSNTVHIITDLIENYEDSLMLVHAKTVDLWKYKDKTLYFRSPLREISLPGLFLKDISNFAGLHVAVFLQLSPKVSLQPLFNVPHVEIIDSEMISLRGLGQNQFVKLHECNNVEDFSFIKSVPKVIISFCQGFFEGYDLENVRSLKLINCNSIHDLSMCKEMKELEIISCVKFTSLKHLPKDIPFLKMRNCPLQSLEGFSALHQKIILQRSFFSSLYKRRKTIPAVLSYWSVTKKMTSEIDILDVYQETFDVEVPMEEDVIILIPKHKKKK
jgi:hypothetical protein